MTEQFLRIGGTDGETARGLRTDESGRVIIGSEKVEEYFVETIELRDKGIKRLNSLNLSKYKSITCFVDNSTDADIRIRPRSSKKFIAYYESGEYKLINGNGIIIPAILQDVIVNDVLPRVFNAHHVEFDFSYNALSTPTSGDLSIRLIGLKG